MRLIEKNDKGNASIGLLISLIVGLVVVGILLFVFAIMGAKFMEATDDGTAINLMNDTIIALSDIVDYFPLIIIMTVIVGIVLLIALIIVVVRRTGYLGGNGEI